MVQSVRSVQPIGSALDVSTSPNAGTQGLFDAEPSAFTVLAGASCSRGLYDSHNLAGGLSSPLQLTGAMASVSDAQTT
jgi:hypothetical protein